MATAIRQVAFSEYPRNLRGRNSQTPQSPHPAIFPWAASGRALTNGRSEGLTKIIVDEKTKRILGAGIVGTNAGELISEIAHAIEMGSDVEDVALTIHPHPTLSESIAMALEVFEGTITDLYMPKKK